MRDYSITKKKGNTHYYVTVVDSFDQNYGAFFRTTDECDKYVYKVWNEEVETSKEMKSLANAIWGCTKLDNKLGLLKGNEDYLD